MLDRGALFGLLLAGLTAAPVPFILAAGPATAQQGGAADGGEAPKQVSLTQKQIDDFVDAQKDLAASQPTDAHKGAASEGDGEGGQTSDQPDPKLQARAEAAVKKHGFSSLEAYEGVFDSIGIVFAGIDPGTKTYIGPAAVIKKQMIQVQADKSLSPKDKTQALSDMKEALGAAGAAKPVAGNADLVVKNYDKLSSAFQGSE